MIFAMNKYYFLVRGQDYSLANLHLSGHRAVFYRPTREREHQKVSCRLLLRIDM